MVQFYTPQRKRNIYDPKDNSPFLLSRSKIDLFLECPRCFYLDRRLGIARPPGFPFTLNTAVDTLLKREFDMYRASGKLHPLIEKYDIDAYPTAHKELEKWRQSLNGIQYLHEPTNLLIYGAIDDLWQNSKGEYIVVDYKATAITGEITQLNKGWHKSYKRQMELYQWLLRKNGYRVSDIGYFVYCNGKVDQEALFGKLEFDITLITYQGSADWVEESISNIYSCLRKDTIPAASDGCDYCAYQKAVQSVLGDKPKKASTSGQQLELPL
jgi:hypothetical protein